ncbi:hypothetical protein Hypma_011856 [Hypsizygus marmoreus]|uniref:Uncharacterized protein n=1 Tax=Hypsizygus marmoreus TaxID=39966 RepID=A0A369JHV8_HYPMA|nr:hypothetical protein Hypma_011856 [Hypsizygus marmoreus]
MSVASPTLLPRPSKFPHLLPKPPQPHPMPLSHRRVYGHLNAVRDLQREMDDLSDEENELEDINLSIHNRGYGFLVPIGRALTQQEEKNDADEDSDDSDDSSRSGGAPSVAGDDGENDSAQDLDASMEDLDEDATADTDNEDMAEGETEDFEEEPSEV